MSNTKLFNLFSLMAVAAVTPACSLAAPTKLAANDGGIITTACTVGDIIPDGGLVAVDSGIAQILPADNVVTPKSCSTNPTATAANPNAIDKYSQGDKDTAANLATATTDVQSLTLDDLTAQMAGTAYGGGGSYNFGDIQRSYDTVSIRGFRYRDASRGMNLGEDMEGSLPNADFQNGQNVGFSTVFPVSMARGASFDMDLEYAVGEAIGDEMQAAQQTLLLAPCMNVLRHPFWGRAQETYGEDPFEIGRMASAMTVGVQQHILANAKHFMGYDIENGRDENDSHMDEQTLRETYGRHFRMVVQDGGVGSAMASYNKVNTLKSSWNKHTLTDVLRTDFGFKGFILSDWWAMEGGNQAVTKDAPTLKLGAQQALAAGLDVELPWALYYGELESLQGTGQLSRTKDLEPAAARILAQKYRFHLNKLTGQVGLGHPITVYQGSEITCSKRHIALATQAAIESMVLLKNDNGTLPISPSVKKVAVLGAVVNYVTSAGSTNTGGALNFATDVRTGDLGSSRAFFRTADGIGPFAGIQGAAPPGVLVVTGNSASAAADADFVVVVAGLTPQDEGEEYTQAGDRPSLELDAKQPAGMQTVQNDLIKAAAALGKPMVVVLEGGSVIDMPWLAQVPAVVMAWYPGQRGGEAMGDLLWGTANGVSYNFSAKLPLTWSMNQDDYGVWNGNGVTNFDYYLGYRLFDHNNISPAFPFGSGLSYTTFSYSNLQLGCTDMSQGAVMPVYVNVTNNGTVAGTEIVMVFVSFPDTKVRRPVKELKAFARVTLNPGETKQVEVPVRLSDLDYFATDSTGQGGSWVVETGPVQIMVGPSAANLPLMQTVMVNGYTVGSTQ